MREKTAVTPRKRSVQTEKPPLDLAIPVPVVWMTGMDYPLVRQYGCPWIMTFLGLLTHIIWP